MPTVPGLQGTQNAALLGLSHDTEPGESRDRICQHMCGTTGAPAGGHLAEC